MVAFDEFGQLRGGDDDALPLAHEPLNDPVDLVLGTHVDAAGRLVEDQKVRVSEHPLRQDDLLLVAARELDDALVDAGRPDP
ncbi:hypothetical protein [Streptomyces atratus]